MKNKIKNWKCHERVVCSMVKEILIGKVVFPIKELKVIYEKRKKSQGRVCQVKVTV